MKPSNELKAVILASYKAFENKDIAFFQKHFSQMDGVLSIGTDPQEWWEGYEKIISVFKAQTELVEIKIVNSNPMAYSEGSVGWSADQVTFKTGDIEIPFRITGVYHQENGAWKAVQWHASIGVPNEEAFKQELPT